MSWADLVLTCAGLPAVAASGYLGVLALLARRPVHFDRDETSRRFDVVVPAHNEEDGIAATVDSLRSVAYPRDRFRVIVVADNCTDGTAARAAAAGATVIVRDEAERRGKGHALLRGFEQSLATGLADAVVVVDADTIVTRNLLTVIAATLASGAEAVQVDYGVRNPDGSWRTRVMTIALACFHQVRSLARGRLRLSCGLRGNGMAFTSSVLRRVPYRAFSIVEDVEYGIELARAGVRVHYAHEAHVFGTMVRRERAARSQRQRWEHGRQALARTHAVPLLLDAWRRRDPVLLDLAADLLVPPLATVACLDMAGLLACGIDAAARAMPPVALAVWSAATAGLLVYVVRGVALSGVGARGSVDLLWAPIYVAWKLTLRFRADGAARKSQWIRTSREAR
jgi:1,2-diacylglycerol 3-beta-glucosyltransferase